MLNSEHRKISFKHTEYSTGHTYKGSTVTILYFQKIIKALNYLQTKFPEEKHDKYVSSSYYIYTMRSDKNLLHCGSSVHLHKRCKLLIGSQRNKMI